MSQGHDNVKYMFTVLLDKFCTNVQSEPHLSDLQGEASNLRMDNTSQGARLYIKARTFWRQGQDACFDIRVTHVNALSYKDLSTNVTFKKHEAEKKREYNQRIMNVEHGISTPLVLGTNGGMGLQSQMFIKRLAEKIAIFSAKVITWIRTRLSFEILRSAVLCVRGSKRPWHKSCQSSNLSLLVSEAEMMTQ